MVNGHDISAVAARQMHEQGLATALYERIMPELLSVPANVAATALLTHLAVVIEAQQPEFAGARRECSKIGEQLWAAVIDIRNARDLARRAAPK